MSHTSQTSGLVTNVTNESNSHSDSEFESVTFRTLVIHMSHQERIVALPEWESPPEAQRKNLFHGSCRFLLFTTSSLLFRIIIVLLLLFWKLAEIFEKRDKEYAVWRANKQTYSTSTCRLFRKKKTNKNIPPGQVDCLEELVSRFKTGQHFLLRTFQLFDLNLYQQELSTLISSNHQHQHS